MGKVTSHVTSASHLKETTYSDALRLKLCTTQKARCTIRPTRRVTHNAAAWQPSTAFVIMAHALGAAIAGKLMWRQAIKTDD
jgi:hypothetical protein